MKLGVGIISLDPCDHVGTAQWLRGSVCISRTMCTKPCKSAETAPTRMLWRLSSGRPGLPACIPAVHTYGRGLDCADGLMRTAEPTCEPPNQPRCAKVQRKPAPGRPTCRPGWPCRPLAFCPPPSPGSSGQMARGREGRRSALRFSIRRRK